MDRPSGAAFLLTQLGTHAARRFGERVAAVDLTPPQAGLLRAVAREPGRSQQVLADRLGTPATRLVALVDALEQRGALERRRNPDDRRLYAVHLTEAGEDLVRDLGRLATEHEDALLATLDVDERRTLADLLGRVAAAEGLTPGVHPGYRDLSS
ncbi:MarR family transcriptional regulator [Actinomycetospora sp. NBRC 106378]|uniref:MarR family winged helix-turn-helix transcriptional regulator n=1 Tax=Actinomycetospora sp. NBRC 106378 TaxID=3032208 RepID=UPI0024A13511|nr:MarR family transcriptional regulator [Actinomycetospora sp. NBRC 106378]GLZ54017.1 MarR family transcriptional regulator [Actinomycetospora sp. NBRC 106378]